MLGAIAGDVVGSVYEHRKAWMLDRRVDFQPLFTAKCRFTDDTVLTVAVAEHLLLGGDLVELLKDYYHRYPDAGFGRDFKAWASSDDPEPYGSWGNGSAMRVSPVGRACSPLAEVLRRAKETARITHDHPEGIKGAQAVAVAVHLARGGASKRIIREQIEKRFQYDLSRTIDEIRPSYVFDSSCQGSVPQALTAFLESTDFEHALRLAVSLGGDCDTLACIAGAVAEPFYGGVPTFIRDEILARLDAPLIAVLEEFERRFP